MPFQMLVLVFGETFVLGLLSHSIPETGPELRAPPSLSAGTSENFKGTMFLVGVGRGDERVSFPGARVAEQQVLVAWWDFLHINNPHGVSSDFSSFGMEVCIEQG